MEIWRHSNCHALVPRSEGLMALPLIATSVTRNVKVDFHAEVKERSMIICKRYLKGLFMKVSDACDGREKKKRHICSS